MKILMLAPEPFFSPRGTPFSEYHRIESLCRLGHQVDLVTYPLGRDVDIPGLRIFRCLNPLGIRKVKTGPSLNKLILDFFLFFSALRRFYSKRYDMIHTHEEAALFAVILRKLRKTPHLYDMHSSLVQQMDNFGSTKSKLVRGFFRWFEKTVLGDASSIIVICPTLFDHAALIAGADKLTLIENFVDGSPDKARRGVSTPDMPGHVSGQQVILYAGTLEAYQGIPLLLEAMALLPESCRLWIAGGQEGQVAAYRELGERMNVSHRVHFFGQLEPDQIPLLIRKASVLVSPRSRGTNIPLKVYSYLKSGKPLVATDILSHTQSLSSDIAILVQPEPADMARGILQALGEDGKSVAEAAIRFCQKKYSQKRYDDLVGEALDKTRRTG